MNQSLQHKPATMSTKDFLKMVDPKEKAVLKDCLEYLKYRPGKFWRQNTGAATYEDKKTGKTRFVVFGVPGQTDIMGITRNGRMVTIETKRKKGKMREKQIQYKNMILENGGLYVEARCLQDIINAGL